MTLRLNGTTSGSVSLDAPATGSNVTLELPTDSIKPGLVLVAEQSFSAVSSVSVNNCFTTTYDNYRMELRVLPSAPNIVTYMRLRSSGVDNTTSNYYTFCRSVSQSGDGTYRVNGNSYFDLGPANSGAGNSVSMDICNPKMSLVTNCSTTTTGYGSEAFSVFGGLYFSLGSQFDGVTIFPASGTASGTIRIYGYRNSL